MLWLPCGKQSEALQPSVNLFQTHTHTHAGFFSSKCVGESYGLLFFGQSRKPEKSLQVSVALHENIKQATLYHRSPNPISVKRGPPMMMF